MGPGAERGRALRWVAGAEALIASRRTPSVKFAIIEPSKEAHDSDVPTAQCRRTRRPRRREPISALGPAGHHYKACEIASSPAFRQAPRDDDPGFSPASRPQDVTGSQ